MTRDRCPVCGASDLEELITLEDYPYAGNGAVRRELAEQVPLGPLSIGICKVCGTLFQMVPVTFEDLDRMLSRQPYPEPQRETGMEIAETEKFLEGLKRNLPAKARILDIGCNTGYIMHRLKEWGYNSVGVDANPSAVKTARSFGMEVLEGRFEAGMFEEESFDVIITRSVLEHALDPLTLLHTMDTILKPGGILAVEVPNIGNVFRRAAFGGFSFHHVFYWTTPTLRYAISLQGLELLGGYEGSYIAQFGKKVEKGEREFDPVPSADEDVEMIYNAANAFLDRKERITDELIDLIQNRFANGISIIGAGTPTVDMLYYTGLDDEIAQIVTTDRSRQNHTLAGTDFTIEPEESLDTDDIDAVIVSSERRMDELLDHLDEYNTQGGQVVRFTPDLEVM